MQHIPGTDRHQITFSSLDEQICKDNPKALKNCFKLYVLFLKEAGLIGAKTVAVDGSKFRASNSKKNNYSQSKIDRHLSYIEQKTEEYLRQLDQADSLELSEQSIQLIQKIQDPCL